MKTLLDIDQAIDRVAKQMTHVEESSVFVARVINALPERRSGFGVWTWRVAGFATVGAAVALAIVLTDVRQSFDGRSTNVPSNALRTPVERSSNTSRTIVERASNDLRTSVERPSNARRLRVERLEPVEPKADHEFSLPSLDVESLSVLDRPVEASIALAPLAIADLPLSGEFPEKP